MFELMKYILKPLTLAGALNWGLVGLFGFDVVAFVFGSGTFVTSVVYSLIGVAAAIWIVMIMTNKK